MVVSHVPHLIDKNVFDEMRRKFNVEWQQTSQHRLRRRDDMQVFEHFFYSNTEMVYSGDLKSGPVHILNGQNKVGLQVVRILNKI